MRSSHGKDADLHPAELVCVSPNANSESWSYEFRNDNGLTVSSFRASSSRD